MAFISGTSERLASEKAGVSKCSMWNVLNSAFFFSQTTETITFTILLRKQAKSQFYKNRKLILNMGFYEEQLKAGKITQKQYEYLKKYWEPREVHAKTVQKLKQQGYAVYTQSEWKRIANKEQVAQRRPVAVVEGVKQYQERVQKAIEEQTKPQPKPSRPETSITVSKQVSIPQGPKHTTTQTGTAAAQIFSPHLGDSPPRIYTKEEIKRTMLKTAKPSVSILIPQQFKTAPKTRVGTMTTEQLMRSDVERKIPVEERILEPLPETKKIYKEIEKTPIPIQAKEFLKGTAVGAESIVTAPVKLPAFFIYTAKKGPSKVAGETLEFIEKHPFRFLGQLVPAVVGGKFIGKISAASKLKTAKISVSIDKSIVNLLRYKRKIAGFGSTEARAIIGTGGKTYTGESHVLSRISGISGKKGTVVNADYIFKVLSGEKKKFGVGKSKSISIPESKWVSKEFSIGKYGFVERIRWKRLLKPKVSKTRRFMTFGKSLKVSEIKSKAAPATKATFVSQSKILSEPKTIGMSLSKTEVKVIDIGKLKLPTKTKTYHKIVKAKTPNVASVAEEIAKETASKAAKQELISAETSKAVRVMASMEAMFSRVGTPYPKEAVMTRIVRKPPRITEALKQTFAYELAQEQMRRPALRFAPQITSKISAQIKTGKLISKQTISKHITKTKIAPIPKLFLTQIPKQRMIQRRKLFERALQMLMLKRISAVRVASPTLPTRVFPPSIPSSVRVFRIQHMPLKTKKSKKSWKYFLRTWPILTPEQFFKSLVRRQNKLFKIPKIK